MASLVTYICVTQPQWVKQLSETFHTIPFVLCIHCLQNGHIMIWHCPSICVRVSVHPSNNCIFCDYKSTVRNHFIFGHKVYWDICGCFGKTQSIKCPHNDLLFSLVADRRMLLSKDWHMQNFILAQLLELHICSICLPGIYRKLSSNPLAPGHWAMGYVEPCHLTLLLFISSPPGQNGPHFADDNFKCIIVNENVCISIKISLMFVPKGPIDISALVQIMAWRQSGDKQAIIWTNDGKFIDAYMRHLASMS